MIYTDKNGVTKRSPAKQRVKPLPSNLSCLCQECGALFSPEYSAQYFCQECRNWSKKKLEQHNDKKFTEHSKSVWKKRRNTHFEL